MKITRIDIIDAKLDPDTPGGWHPLFLEIHTDEGVRGIGEMAPAYSPGIRAGIARLRDQARHLIGADPFEIQHLTARLLGGAFGMPSLDCGHAASAIDIALYDLKGKALGIPVYDLLGGKVRDSVRVYYNGWAYDLREPEEYADAARKVVAAGFTAMKFDPFRYFEGGFRWPIQSPGAAPRSRWLRLAVARVAAVREAVGSDVDILLECHGKFDVPTAVAIAEAMRDMDLYWQEEPTGSGNVAKTAEVAERTGIPVATGERLVGRDAFRPFVEERACAVLQPDLGMAGGITECRAIAEYARQHGIFFAPHNAGGPVCTAASVQLDAASPNFLIQETFPSRPPEYFDFVRNSYESRVQDGFLKIPDTPGLGVELNEDRIRDLPRITLE